MNVDHCTEIELDNGMLVHVTLQMWLDPGERGVRYYSDGSGHPGMPASLTYEGVIVEAIEGDGYKVDGIQKPDWFELLDDIIDDIIQTKPGLLDRLQEEAFDCWEDSYEDFGY